MIAKRVGALAALPILVFALCTTSSLANAQAANQCYKSDQTKAGTQAADMQCIPKANEIVSKSAPKTSMCGTTKITNIYGQKCSETTASYTITGMCTGPQTCCVTSFQRLNGSEIAVQNCSAAVLTSGSAQDTSNQSSQVPGSTGVPAQSTNQSNLGDTQSATPPSSSSNGNTSSSGNTSGTGNTGSSLGSTQSSSVPGSQTSSGGGSLSSSGSGLSASGGSSSGGGSLLGSSPANPTPVSTTGSGNASAPTQTFNGNSNLGTVARGSTGGSASGSLSPVASGGVTNSGSLTKSTFGSGSSFSSGSSIHSGSSLTSAFSSIGSIASSPIEVGSAILSFFTGLLSADTSSGSSQTVVNRTQIVEVPVIPEQQPQTVVQTLPQTTQVSQPQLGSDQYYEFLGQNSAVNTSAASSLPQLTNIINGQPQSISITLTIAEEPVVENAASPLSITTNITSPFDQAATTTSKLAVFTSDSPALSLNMVGTLSGEWTYSSQHLQNEKSLAQAQSNYEGLVAQEQALQAAQNADVCNDNCESSLAQVEAEIPEAQSQVQQLTGVVNEPIPASFGESPSNIAAQVTGFAPEATLGDNSESAGVLPNGSAQAQNAGGPSLSELGSEATQGAPPIVVQIPETPPNFTPIPENYTASGGSTSFSSGDEVSAPLDPIEQFVANIWNTVQSWFSPVATSTPDRSQSCSLFASLFGGCKGW